MSQVAFIAALAAEISAAHYERPMEVGSSRSEWVIVHRWGATSEYLSLSLTNTQVRDQASAPPGLQPMFTYLGLLMACSDTDGRAEADYLLVRQLPLDVMVGGVFHPSDGHVHVTLEDGIIRVVAHGRYAHCRGISRGVPVVRDIPAPAPGYEHAHAWHLTGVQRPWIGEFIAGQPAAAGQLPANTRGTPSAADPGAGSAPPTGVASALQPDAFQPDAWADNQLLACPA